MPVAAPYAHRTAATALQRPALKRHLRPTIAASSLFAKRVQEKQPGALDRYLNLLKAGGSNYPYDLVKTAGVDLATPEPYQALVARMNAIMDEIEAILARQKK